MIRIPNDTKRFTQTNSDVLGNLFATFNCDLTSNPGTIRGGKRLLLNTSTADVTELTAYPVGFRYYGGKYWTAAGTIDGSAGYAFNNGGTIPGAFTKVTGANSPSKVDSKYSDIEIANWNTSAAELYVSEPSVSGNNKVCYTADGSTWATALTIGSAGDPMMFTFFGQRMYCTFGGYKIGSWDKDHTIVKTTNDYYLALGYDEVITFIRSASDRIWIGTVNQHGGKGVVYSWDGKDALSKYSYRLESSGALACVIKDDVPYIIDTNGDLLSWNGGTFKKLAGLNRLNNKPLFNPFDAENNRFIHPNGMSVIKGKINMLIDGTNYDVTTHGGTQEVTIPSGIWEYDPDIGLYHKHSFTQTKAGATSITDYGQVRIYGAGALAEILTADSPITTDGTFLAGCSYYTNATSTTSGIFYDNNNDDVQKYLSFITPKIFSSQIKDTWQKIYARIKALATSGDKIVIKYRMTDPDPVETTITWIDTNTCKAVADVTGKGGYEMEVVQGTGSGKCAHVTGTPYGAGPYIVDLDDTFTGVTTGTAKARFQNWIKAGEFTTQDLDLFECPIGKTSTWIQFKVCIQGTGTMELNDLTIINATHKKAE